MTIYLAAATIGLISWLTQANFRLKLSGALSSSPIICDEIKLNNGDKHEIRSFQRNYPETCSLIPLARMSSELTCDANC